MRTGRPIPRMTITGEERETLERWNRRANTAQALAQRARVILGCAAGKRNTHVAHELRSTKQTVGKWRTRFLTKRREGLLDEPRPGAPRTVTDAAVEAVLTRTLEAGRRDTLEHALDGASMRAESEHGPPDLAGLRSAAASHRDLQTVERSTGHRESPGHRGPLPKSPGPSVGPLCRREEPNPSAGSDAAAVADASGSGGAAQP